MSMRNSHHRAKGQSRQFVVRSTTAVKLKGEVLIGLEPEDPDHRPYAVIPTWTVPTRGT